jgi:hypothetical protein
MYPVFSAALRYSGRAKICKLFVHLRRAFVRYQLPVEILRGVECHPH